MAKDWVLSFKIHIPYLLAFQRFSVLWLARKGGIKLSILPVRLYMFLNIFRFHNVYSHFGKRILFLYELRWKFQNDLPAPGCRHLWDSYSLKPSIRLPSIFSAGPLCQLIQITGVAFFGPDPVSLVYCIPQLL